MNERQIALSKVQKAMAENTYQIKAMRLNVIVCEAKVKSLNKQAIKLEKIYKDRINKIQLLIEKSIKNIKLSDKTLDDLLEEKEALYLEFKAANHFGKKQCEYCLNYFTPQGFSRHKDTCSAKPEIKIEKEHKKEVKEIKEDLEARKAVLQKELEALEKESEKRL